MHSGGGPLWSAVSAFVLTSHQDYACNYLSDWRGVGGVAGEWK